MDVFEVAQFLEVAACGEDEEATLVEVVNEGIAEPAMGAGCDEDGAFCHGVRLLGVFWVVIWLESSLRTEDG
jgi:hypothetical protein